MSIDLDELKRWRCQLSEERDAYYEDADCPGIWRRRISQLDEIIAAAERGGPISREAARVCCPLVLEGDVLLWVAEDK